MSPKEPPQNLNDMPRMIPDRDDIAMRRKRFSDDPEAVDKASGQPAKSGGGGTSIGLVVVLIAVLGVCGYLGWQNYNMQQQLQLSSEELAISIKRIEALENQLTTTGENMNLSESALQARLKNIMSEIRKLWDVSNKRNKGWIKKNEEDLAKLQQGQADQVKSLDGIKASVAKASESVSGAEARAIAATETVDAVVSAQSTIKNDVTTINSKLSSLGAAVGETTTQLGELSLTMQLLSDQVNGSDASQLIAEVKTNFEKFSSEAGQDIESINANRVQVNQRLTSLQKQIQSLEAQIQSMKQ